jgi:hypothetical protein
MAEIKKYEPQKCRDCSKPATSELRAWNLAGQTVGFYCGDHISQAMEKQSRIEREGAPLDRSED